MRVVGIDGVRGLEFELELGIDIALVRRIGISRMPFPRSVRRFLVYLVRNRRFLSRAGSILSGLGGLWLLLLMGLRVILVGRMD